MVGRYVGHFVKISLDEFWLFTTVSNGKKDKQRSNRLKCISVDKEYQ